MIRTYKEFTKDVIFAINQLNEIDDCIIHFTCVEPTTIVTKQHCTPFKRSEYIEVVSLNDSNNGLIWFSDWYEGCQTSFTIKSIIPISECASIVEKNNLLYEQNNNLYDALRDCYEYIGDKIGGFTS